MSYTESLRIRIPCPNIVAGTYEVYGSPEPDIYRRVTRRGFRVWEWELTAGRYGQSLVSGEAKSKRGARLDGLAASQNRRLLQEWVGGGLS